MSRALAILCAYTLCVIVLTATLTWGVVGWWRQTHRAWYGDVTVPPDGPAGCAGMAPAREH